MRSLWERFSAMRQATLVLSAIAVVTIIALAASVIFQNRTAADLKAELTTAQNEGAAYLVASEERQSDIDAIAEQLGSADERIAELEVLVAEQEAALADAEADSATGEAEAKAERLAAAQRLGESRTKLIAAQEDKKEAEVLVAELTLAYSEEIDSARQTLSVSATAFSCEWGAAKAIGSSPFDSITGAAALQAFASSDALTTLTQDQSIATALTMADRLRYDLYAVTPAEAQTAAAECWQREDAKVNAALYQYRSLFAEAALDAACTQGGDQAFIDFSETAAYQSWRLNVGSEAAYAYRNSIVDRFGSIEAFLGIPAADVAAESARCDDIRDLISPKHPSTWNVGDEIKAGTWKAYDVSDCYWARLAENGRILANQFGDGLRLSVNVAGSDGQFEISGCTFYFANP
jgi:hypothetical protein